MRMCILASVASFVILCGIEILCGKKVTVSAIRFANVFLNMYFIASVMLYGWSYVISFCAMHRLCSTRAWFIMSNAFAA